MTFEFPSSVTVSPSTVPGLVMAPPLAPEALVLPIVGPTGPQGEQGDVGPAGPQGPPGDSASALAYVYNQTVPVTTIVINHGLAFNPAGIVCLESDGSPPLLGVSVSYPSTGVTELNFGVPFTGEIYLS